MQITYRIFYFLALFGIHPQILSIKSKPVKVRLSAVYSAPLWKDNNELIRATVQLYVELVKGTYSWWRKGAERNAEVIARVQ